MPRKTKDTENKIVKNSKTNSNNDVMETSTSTKKAKTASARAKKVTSSTAKKASEKSPVKNKKATTTTKKNSLATKSTTKKTKSTSKPKKAVAKKVPKEELLEYYDLPYRYNETIVKILAQTPKKLFIYWDISDTDRKIYIEKFGNDFFDNTVPILIVHNKSMNYSFEVEINDFANCWYLDINDAKCDYIIDLGRRSKIQSYYIPNNYIHVASSNKIESPNDHILFEKQSQTIYFRNVKNNTTHQKNIANVSFIERIGKVYSIYDTYKKLYDKIYDNKDFLNNPTSTFK